MCTLRSNASQPFRSCPIETHFRCVTFHPIELNSPRITASADGVTRYEGGVGGWGGVRMGGCAHAVMDGH